MNSVLWGLYWKVCNCSAAEELPGFVETKAHYRVPKSFPLDRVLSQFSPVHIINVKFSQLFSSLRIAD
jgi:hypothetical protein